MCTCVSPVFEPVTEGVYTLIKSGRFHAVRLLLPLLVVLLCGHRGELLYGVGGGDDDGVGTLPRQQVVVDRQDAVQELYRHRGHRGQGTGDSQRVELCLIQLLMERFIPHHKLSSFFY